jgi:hypothetical protein
MSVQAMVGSLGIRRISSLAHKDEARDLIVGHTLFTAAGAELTKIANVSGREDVRKATLDYWREQGWTEAAINQSTG